MNILTFLTYGAIMLVLTVAAAGVVAMLVRWGKPHATPLSRRPARPVLCRSAAVGAAANSWGPNADPGLEKHYQELDQMTGGAVYGLWE